MPEPGQDYIVNGLTLKVEYTFTDRFSTLYVVLREPQTGTLVKRQLCPADVAIEFGVGRTTT